MDIHARLQNIKQAFDTRKELRLLKLAGSVLASAACVLMVGAMLGSLLLNAPAGKSTGSQSADAGLMDRFDMYMTNQRSDALDGVLDVEKVYWLKDEDIAAPEPDQSKFGSTTDPSSLQWLLDEAEELLDGQTTLFSTDIEILPGSEVQYYLDETILSICWKQAINGACYNFNEVKIAHPSQFRRFLADGQYGSPKQYLTTQMSSVVNAVSASNADFYKYRTMGVVVYNGQVYRSENTPDTCFIDDQGEMVLVQDRTFATQEELETYVKENNIRFSISFGPILVENYEIVVPQRYELGEVNDHYSRAALADMGDLHYLVVCTSFEGYLIQMPTIAGFAEVVHSLGCEKAYTLDGGQTAIIIMNDEMFSSPNYDSQRYVSDMIYFATALPDGG